MEVATLVTNILTALGTVGAVIVAILLGLSEQKRGNKERERMAEERARTQASHVMAWDSTVTVRYIHDDGSFGHIIRRERTVSVKNISSGPVFDLRVLSPSDDVMVEYLMLLPSEQESVSLHRVESETDIVALARLSFRDMVGIRWERSISGALARVNG